MVWYGAVWYGMVGYGTVWCGMVGYGGVVVCGLVWYDRSLIYGAGVSLI